MEQDKSQEVEGMPQRCLKCGSHIAHIPYCFDGKMFHARCLLCNACGKRLVGKPFITNSRQIFCGEQCKSQFEKEECSTKQQLEPPLSDLPNDSTLSSSLDESLLEVLERTTDSSQQLAMERMTDYPLRRMTGSPRVHPPTPTHSETDSTSSTYSEGSIHSDGSLYIHDANRKPKKKILKDSDASHRRKHKHRVRWNLDKSDAVSVDSFHSAIVGNTRLDVGLRPSPLGGSTGSGLQMRSPSPPPYLRPPSWSTRYSTLQKRPTSSGRILRTNSETHLITHQQRQHTHLPSPQKPVTQSTPIKYHRQLHHTSTSLQQLPRFENDGSILNVSVFIPDENKILPHDTSNLDDKKRSQLFEFPQQKARRQLLVQDDADDYDHLPEKEMLTVSDKVSKNKWSGKQDIEEALKQLNEEMLDARGIATHQALPQSCPPPVPPKNISVPPPVPPKNFSKNLQPPFSVNHNGTPPPVPERKSSLPSSYLPAEPEQQPSKETMHSSEFPGFPDDDNLQSQSCETLIDDNETKAPSPLHTQDDALTPVEAEVHPDSQTEFQSIASWESFAPNTPLSAPKLKDRIVEGAEDPDRPPSTTPLTTTNPPVSSMSNGLGHLESTNSQKDDSTPSALQEFMHRSFSYSSTNGNSYHQPAPYQFRRRQVNKVSQGKLPEVLADLLPEDQYLYQRYSSGQGPLMMKPIRVDADSQIEEMLAELDSAVEISQRKQQVGICSICHKPIPNLKLLVNFSGKLYHTACFNCSSCGCSMKEKPIYQRNGSILCMKDYQRLNGPQPVSNTHFMRPQRQWHCQPPPPHSQQQHQGHYFQPYNRQAAQQGRYQYQKHIQQSAGPGTAV